MNKSFSHRPKFDCEPTDTLIPTYFFLGRNFIYLLNLVELILVLHIHDRMHTQQILFYILHRI